jgi:chorismate mutase / prephenate dehydratase
MSLDDLRKEIDQLDSKMVKLIAERVNIAKQIGMEKSKLGMQIEDKYREKLVFEKLRDNAKTQGLSPDHIESIYNKIIDACKNVQHNTRVAFQGEIGAYSEEAAFNFFGDVVDIVPFDRFDKVFKAVDEGKVEFGVVPVENSLEGSISQVYDLLLDSPLRVYGEVKLRVIHCLIANPNTQLGLVKKVFSHPQALGQCRNFLRHLNCELIPTYDTAGSVKMIKEEVLEDGAAIASARAAEIYGMNIISKGIEDNPNNFTRFFVLSKHDASPTGNDKASIVFSVKHKPGALYRCLKELARRNINLTKIESRPTRQKPWEYNFYLDCENYKNEEELYDALNSLEKNSIFMKLLGSYPRAEQEKRGTK